MRTTVDLPDDLFRRAKAFAAQRGRKLKDVIQEGILRVLETPDEPGIQTPQSAYELMKDACGVVGSGVNDLGSNPKHLEGFGRS